ncbi:MAG: carbon-nitrogen hydrolase family protein [Desulfarculaceae bacterium]|nr:carbon-nitrogen hydrolase family protein [Desulfarculaceae bacterium]MCF8048353.1 carbon-nitrogen hydrolase family protein [Desulfarculaceae bacterium]MCF8064559.1 carbon-nitrogen hydrolase family protein [Desulfarculaceae bacterium]MCF8099275.1 carbon-nitrogen hydrolase family protein [Desulfarculaceae bacterium]MCF8123290.1 carbon-nitrogen hydrolase family protein [Desulfarculaceae bacterium]
MRITLAQINFDPENVEGHIRRIKEIISQERGSDLIVFPELILHGHPSQVKPEGFLYRKVKCAIHGASQDIYQHVKQCGARVVLGELKREGDGFLNLATYVDARGAKSYAKAHVHWTENFQAGGRLKVFSTPLGRLGLNICYDSAFSEAWRVLGLNGARLVVNISAVPAHFPVPYMRRRMQAAAVFNQYFVVYANRPGPVFSGGSAVYDPHGDELLALGGGDEVAQVEFDVEQVQRWREEEVIFPNRRPLLYRRVASRNKEIPGPKQERHLKVAG